MWKAAFVGALALVTLGSMSVTSNGIGVTQAAAQEVVVTDAHIARLRSVLRLSPAQEVHWRGLEAALRNVGQRGGSDEPQGLVQKVKARLKSYVLDAAAAHRVAAAAQPLIATLDEGQKQEGLTVIRAMGVSALF
jgi:zinc resistance-associated protein